MQLEDRDRHLLGALGTEARTVSTIGAILEVSADEVSARLDTLADNGLVHKLDDDRYERTESGRRVLVAEGSGAVDGRIDTSTAVEETLESYDLRADENEALRRAYGFLRYWGAVTDAEIADAVYSEVPAGHDSQQEWFDDVISQRLGALPDVKPPESEESQWRYTGRAGATDAVADGRRVLTQTHPGFGDVRHAIETLDLDEAERAAARAAFAYLYHQRETTADDIRSDLYPTHPAGYDSADAWWETLVVEVFEELPGVVRTGDCRWRYRSVD